MPTNGGAFDADARAALELRLATAWNAGTIERAQQLTESLAQDSRTNALRRAVAEIKDMAEEEGDEWLRLAAASLTDAERMAGLMVSATPAFLEVKVGPGGAEACDCAALVLRMYLRFCTAFDGELVSTVPGKQGGVRSAIIHARTPGAYEELVGEHGTHRMVRQSPFDGNGRTHTSFVQVCVSPEMPPEAALELPWSDIRVNTSRGSGPGGQHRNKRDTAVRLTHIPSGLAVRCQSERSQHRNKATAYALLRAKLAERANADQAGDAQPREPSGWGHQVRIYALDNGWVKDLRTRAIRHDLGTVLDGDIAGLAPVPGA